MIRYTGDYDYSLIRDSAEDVAVSQMKGIMVDLGFTSALLSGDEQKTLDMDIQGIEYRLTSGTLPETEMIESCAICSGRDDQITGNRNIFQARFGSEIPLLFY